MSSSDSICFTVVFEDPSELPTTQELRTALQKGTDEVKIDTLRKIVIATLNGSAHVSACVVVVQWFLKH